MPCELEVIPAYKQDSNVLRFGFQLESGAAVKILNILIFLYYQNSVHIPTFFNITGISFSNN
jgi:hypothetical protein